VPRAATRLLVLTGGLVLAALLGVACGSGNDEDGSSSGNGGMHTPAPDVPISPTTIPPSCEGPSIASIQRTGQRNFRSPPERVIDPANAYVAEMQTSRGVITIELAAADAPNTVNNFVYLSCVGYFDGLTFHRVVRDPQPFVIQGGDPSGNGRGGPGYIFADEFSPNLRHEAGVISMANSGPDTNGSQFFITLAPAHHLDDKHSIFGRVTAGMDAANRIQQGDLVQSVTIKEIAPGGG
jgi:peptidyl-prolyl cis-trans isomerase B (cyclophilin B)